MVALAAFGLSIAAVIPASAFADGSAPILIDIPKIGTHALVVPLGLDVNGAMQAPDDPDVVGWYAPGVMAGVPGNMLLDGHVDWAGRLRAFGFLKELNPGDSLQITTADGSVLSYTVMWTQLYDADTAPVDDIFQQTNDQEVTLITCGGAFDHAMHMYLSRWVVRAILSNPLAVSTGL